MALRIGCEILCKSDRAKVTQPTDFLILKLDLGLDKTSYHGLFTVYEVRIVPREGSTIYSLHASKYGTVQSRLLVQLLNHALVTILVIVNVSLKDCFVHRMSFRGNHFHLGGL